MALLPGQRARTCSVVGVVHGKEVDLQDSHHTHEMLKELPAIIGS